MALRCSMRVTSSCISTFSRPRSSSVQSFSVGEGPGCERWKTRLLPAQQEPPPKGGCMHRKEVPGGQTSEVFGGNEGHCGRDQGCSPTVPSRAPGRAARHTVRAEASSPHGAPTQFTHLGNSCARDGLLQQAGLGGHRELPGLLLQKHCDPRGTLRQSLKAKEEGR